MKTNKVIETFEKAPKEEQQKLLPILKKLPSLIEAHNEGVKRKYEFSVQFTTVVGVLFGVLAAFNTMDECILADIFYLIGIISCGVCLCLCLLCLYKPVHDNEQKQVDIIDDITEELKRAAEVEEQEQETEKEKPYPIESLRRWAYITFGVSIVCVLLKLITLFFVSIVNA